MPEPSPGPGTPEQRGPARYLWWLVTSQRRRVAAGSVLGSAWMVGLTLPPYLLARAIDDGLEPGEWGILMGWSGALLGMGILNAWLAIMRHRTMTRIRMDATFRTVRVLVRHITALGAALSRRLTSGEIVTIGVGDVARISQALTVTGPGVGAVLAYGVVAMLLLRVSPLLATVVLVGVPLFMVLLGPLLSRLRRAETLYREQQGGLAARVVDVVGGLRVLNGLGGKSRYAGHYRLESQKLQAEGYHVGSVTSWIQALGVGAPTLFLAAVTWLAARMAAQGEITVGELVAVYGYVAVLVVPVSFFIEGAYDVSRGLVAARRVVRVLNLAPDTMDGPGAIDAPIGPAPLHDPESGVRIEPGELTVLAGAGRTGAALIDRLGRYTESAVTWGSTRLSDVRLQQVRDRILVADGDADLFAGSLREMLSGRWERDEAAIARAVEAALAEDVVLGLPNGLDSAVTAQGRNLSGGQRQRVRLARALLADPEMLLAAEPTSAVDAHTEAEIATRLYAARSGRTTVIASTSPLVLDHADTVHYLAGDRLVASGTHRELMSTQPGYRRLVSRAAGDDELLTTPGTTR